MEKMQRSVVSNKQAVAGVIEALLLVALVAMVISTIQLYYIPEVMKQREAEHMDEVSNQFSHLKAMIDIQTTTGSDTPIFSILTLGSRELPYFLTAASHGYVSIETSGNSYIQSDGVGKIVDLTSIRYFSDNLYFTKQIYALEGGGIIVAQPGQGSVMRVNPAINYIETETDFTITFNLPIFIDYAGKNSTQGVGKCVIRTNYSSTTSSIKSYPALHIRIYTEYPRAWNQTFNDLLGNKLNVFATDAYVQINTPTGKDLVLDFTYVRIHAQIGPGWIIGDISN